MLTVSLQSFSAIAPGIFFDAQCPPRESMDMGAVGAGNPDWFDSVQFLPRIKHRYWNNIARYGLAATLPCGFPADAHISEIHRGVVLGTSVADFVVRDQFDGDVLSGGAEALNSVAAPNISANIAAAHIAMICRARAFSTTLTSPVLAGFESIFLGILALRQGQCQEVLAIASEETVPDASGGQVLPGATALRLVIGTKNSGRRIHPLTWGRATGSALQNLMKSVAAIPVAAINEARSVIIQSDDPESCQSALHCSDVLSSCGVSDQTTTVCSGAGSLEPMLRAMYWLTESKQPVILLAIHQRRFLAFHIHHPHQS